MNKTNKLILFFCFLGDKVLSLNGQIAEVLCAIHTHMNGGKTHLVTLPSGLKLTPYHPIVVEGEWKFPADVAIPKYQTCPVTFKKKKVFFFNTEK